MVRHLAYEIPGPVQDQPTDFLGVLHYNALKICKFMLLVAISVYFLIADKKVRR